MKKDIFVSLLENYKLHAEASGFSPHHIKHIDLSVRLFAEFLTPEVQIERITADDFRRFLSELRKRANKRGSRQSESKHLSGTTINTYARGIKAFFSWMHESGILKENPLANVPTPKKPKTIPKVYREKDLRAIFDSIDNDRDRAIITLFLDSGIRLSELTRLNIGEVDIESGSIKVFGKGSKERYVYFSRPVTETLKKYIRDNRSSAANKDPLFVTRKGTRITGRGVQSMLKRLGENAGVAEQLSPHKLRHTFATQSSKYGASTEYLRKILGHSDIKTTSESYLNVLDEDVKSAHEHFSPITNLLEKLTPDVDTPQNENNELSKERPQRQLFGPDYFGETSHEASIRETATDIIRALSLPFTKDCFVPDWHPGHITLGKSGRTIQVSPGGQVTFGSFARGSLREGIFRQALFSHLETGGFDDIYEAIIRWGKAAGRYIRDCHDFFEQVHAATRSAGLEAASISHLEAPGYTEDFPILICADALERNLGSHHYTNFLYSQDRNGLKFGGTHIYISSDDHKLKQAEEAHRKLRIECSGSPQTMQVAAGRKRLDNQAFALGERLRTFISFKFLPGTCALEAEDGGC